MQRPTPSVLLSLGLLFHSFAQGAGLPKVPLFTVYEAALVASGSYSNPYIDVEAEAVITPPGGGEERRLPLFWDGGASWKFRISPDIAGEWEWKIRSRDPGLNGKTGRLKAEPSSRPGSIRPMRDHPRHFERQDGSGFYFLGDTAWALYTDNDRERHNREAAERYLEKRAADGFNVVHSMVLSEAGWGNRGGPPFEKISTETINPAYWREVDHRLAYANRLGLVCGLALAWGDKRDEPYAWRKFPSLDARRRYARYIAARYSAYDVYFIVAGEWHAEIASRRAPHESVRSEFIEIGSVIRAHDSHRRMIAIHPMNGNGSVREFNAAPWMSFGDYQQNYNDLHARVIQSLRFDKPVVNSEYGYYLRDQNGDGTPDKENSTTLEIMRHATWDIVMAGGYVVTGFGTTYFGGNRDPGPFELNAEKNTSWEQQIALIKQLFTQIEWWKLEPQDALLHCRTARGQDRSHLGRVAPPQSTYWCLADHGRLYLLYVRGTTEALELGADSVGPGWQTRQWNTRTGESTVLTSAWQNGKFVYNPPDKQDWVAILNRP